MPPTYFQCYSTRRKICCITELTAQGLYIPPSMMQLLIWKGSLKQDRYATDLTRVHNDCTT